MLFPSQLKLYPGDTGDKYPVFLCNAFKIGLPIVSLPNLLSLSPRQDEMLICLFSNYKNEEYVKKLTFNRALPHF